MDAATTRALHRILDLIDNEPIEDGVTHSCERYLAVFLREHGTTPLHAAMFSDHRSSTTSAGLLRLLGRMQAGGVDSKGPILNAALSATSIELRDAAIEAAESWADAESVAALREHAEPLPWLADYLRRVLRDIAG